MRGHGGTGRSSLGWLLPVLAAICAVVGVDAWAAMATERGAQALSANALRSVELAEDMRWQLSGLGLGPEPLGADAEKVQQALAWLKRDVAAYEPLATFEGERPEWLTLSRLTREIEDDLSRGDRAEGSRDAASAQEAVERLIALNRAEADSIEMQLAGLGRRQVAVDGLAGVVVVLAFAGMARSRLRSLEREREAVALSLETVQSKNRDLEAFAGRVAHDLRSPLAPVQVLAGVLARGGQPDPEVQRLGTRIAGAANRMSGVIEAMLAFSRSGQLPPGECALGTVAQDVIDELLAEPQGVDLRIALPQERVACAPEVLAQILRNLVGNAIKFRAEGRRCRVEVVGTVDGPSVRVTVEDNGIGMDPQAVCRAFEPFFRASPDRAGHGLGLAIVDRYVRAMGGSVLLTSQPDVGTRVELRLPRASSVPAAVLDLRVTARPLEVPAEGSPGPPSAPLEEGPTARA